jgi:hypothetical protein
VLLVWDAVHQDAGPRKSIGRPAGVEGVKYAGDEMGTGAGSSRVAERVASLFLFFVFCFYFLLYRFLLQNMRLFAH